MTPATDFAVMSDPGHGWLLVSLSDLIAVGLTEADISPYSYRRGGTVGLEEDCDMAVFLTAWCRKMPGYPNIRGTNGSCRDWASFGTMERLDGPASLTDYDLLMDRMKSG